MLLEYFVCFYSENNIFGIPVGNYWEKRKSIDNLLEVSARNSVRRRQNNVNFGNSLDTLINDDDIFLSKRTESLSNEKGKIDKCDEEIQVDEEIQSGEEICGDEKKHVDEEVQSDEEIQCVEETPCDKEIQHNEKTDEKDNVERINSLKLVPPIFFLSLDY